ncbi:MAG: PEP-CTERM sorting domain-containing protein [Planctomycetota bacterium]
MPSAFPPRCLTVAESLLLGVLVLLPGSWANASSVVLDDGFAAPNYDLSSSNGRIPAINNDYSRAYIEATPLTGGNPAAYLQLRHSTSAGEAYSESPTRSRLVSQLVNDTTFATWPFAGDRRLEPGDLGDIIYELDVRTRDDVDDALFFTEISTADGHRRSTYASPLLPVSNDGEWHTLRFRYFDRFSEFDDINRRVVRFGFGFVTSAEFGAEGGNVQSFIDVDNFRITFGDLATLAGDYNGDGRVGQGDLNLVLNNWGRLRYVKDGITNFATGTIDQEELNTVLNHWGDALAPPDLRGSPVPEPAALALTGLGALTLTRRRTPA